LTEPNVDELRPAPAIAPPPARRRTGSDLWRLLPYIFPYRVRWIAMLTVAVVSLAATVSIPIL
jgi:ATP-binding cassette subfamily B protein